MRAVANRLARAALAEGFVQPIEDSTMGHIGGLPGVMEALVQAVQTIRHGAALACDFSRLRPLHALVTGPAAEVCGPLACMQVLARACEAWSSGAGPRRGALAALLRVDHPDIERVLDAMSACDLRAPGPDRLAIGITDAFMHAVEHDDMFQLLHVAPPSYPSPLVQCPDGVARHVYQTVRARALWERIVRSAHASGEPGVVWLDRMERGNNLWYCERLAAPAPCGGPALAFYGGCCPAAVDLRHFVGAPGSARATFRHAAFARVIATGVELLDCALDVAHWPLAQQAAQAQGKRRIALGFVGLAQCMTMLGLLHGSAPAMEFTSQLARTLRDAAYRASARLAQKLGAFPLFDADSYLDPQTFAASLPEDIRKEIRQHGIRNSHLLWLPPCESDWIDAADDGSLAQAARADLAPRDRLAMAAAVAPFIDGGVTAAIALPVGDDIAPLADAWWQAWRLGLHACDIA